MKWDELSMKDKAAVIKIGVSNGITKLEDIKNKFDEGGYKKKPSWIEKPSKELEDAFWQGNYNKMADIYTKQGKELTYITPDSNLNEVIISAKNLKKEKQLEEDYNKVLDLGITAAGFIPGIGEFADFADIINQVRQENYKDAILSTAGLALPFVSSRGVRKAYKYITDKKFRDKAKTLIPRIKEYSSFKPEITSLDNLSRFNKEILKDREIINQLKQAEYDYSKGRIELDERLPPITSLALNTTRGKKAYPEGYELIYRGIEPQSNNANIIPSFDDKAIFTFVNPDNAAYYQSVEKNLYHNKYNFEKPVFIERQEDMNRGGVMGFLYPKNIKIKDVDAKGHNFGFLNKVLGDKYPTTDDIAFAISNGDLPTTLLRNIEDGAFGDEIIYNNIAGQYLKSIFGSNLKFDLNDPRPFKKGGKLKI